MRKWEKPFHTLHDRVTWNRAVDDSFYYQPQGEGYIFRSVCVSTGEGGKGGAH